MTIDEAISHAREKAKEIRENIIDGDNLEPYESYCNAMVAKSAEEQEQLAEWLEELKALRDGLNIKCDRLNEALEKGKNVGYNKAIDDFVNACKQDILCQTFGLHINGIERIAEQLKVGD